jgi:hypothetical protein
VRWNRASTAGSLRYSVEAIEPDEAPLEPDRLMAALGAAGLTIVRRRRIWEVFPRRIPATLVDRLAIRALNRLHGASGNVLAVAARKASR